MRGKKLENWLPTPKRTRLLSCLLESTSKYSHKGIFSTVSWYFSTVIAQNWQKYMLKQKRQGFGQSLSGATINSRARRPNESPIKQHQLHKPFLQTSELDYSTS
eukprot:3409892-Pleurochrysis_carterae.AAC.1